MGINEDRNDFFKDGLLEPRISHFEREVRKSYGVSVSVVKKAKGLLKFGENQDVGTSKETVWEIGGHETYVTTNIIDTVSSDDAGDDQELCIEGHTVVGTGVDAEFTFVTQQATLDGQNKVVLSTPLARVSRVFNDDTTEMTGDVWVYEDTAITAGVPSDVTKAHILCLAEHQQSTKGATTISNSDFYAITELTFDVEKKTSAAADFHLEVREVGKVFRTRAILSASSDGGAIEVEFDPPIIIPSNADVRITANASTNGAACSAAFDGYLAEIL